MDNLDKIKMYYSVKKYPFSDSLDKLDTIDKIKNFVYNNYKKVNKTYSDGSEMVCFGFCRTCKSRNVDNYILCNSCIQSIVNKEVETAIMNFIPRQSLNV